MCGANVRATVVVVLAALATPNRSSQRRSPKVRTTHLRSGRCFPGSYRKPARLVAIAAIRRDLSWPGQPKDGRQMDKGASTSGTSDTGLRERLQAALGAACVVERELAG